MNKAISDLLDSASKSTENALKNAEIDAFQPIKIKHFSVFQGKLEKTVNCMSDILCCAE